MVKQHIRNFTLFEILIAVALLSVLSVVLLRVFVLTADFWTAGDEQARLYADAKTALTILSEDLSNVMYSPRTGDSSAKHNIAPMWLEASNYVNTYKEEDNLIPSAVLSAVTRQPEYDKANYCPILHCVTFTDWGRSSSAKSQVCKVGYAFVPPQLSGSDRTLKLDGSHTADFSADGELARFAVSDTTDTPGIDLKGNLRDLYDFFPLDKDKKKTVITGVLDFRVYAYDDNSDGGDGPVPMVSDVGTKVQLDAPGVTQSTGNSKDSGLVGLKRIQLVLTLMPESRFAELRRLRQKNDEDGLKECIQKYARTFRKTIRIKEMKE